jgi:gluconate 2-dehydrogenase alpha chain
VAQPADLVILASYTFNNTRLMLLSGIGKPYDPVNNQGVVGRNYSYQTGGKGSLFFEDREFNPFIGGGMTGTSIDDLNGENFDHSNLGFIGGAYVATQSNGTEPIHMKLTPPGAPRWGSGWKQATAQYYRRSFATRTARQSYRNHYLDLDPTYRDANGLPLLRMTFNWHETSKCPLHAHMRGSRKRSARQNRPSLSPRAASCRIKHVHNIGGAVMGADPATSALNLQSWTGCAERSERAMSVERRGGLPGRGAIAGALACWAPDRSRRSRFISGRGLVRAGRAEQRYKANRERKTMRNTHGPDRHPDTAAHACVRPLLIINAAEAGVTFEPAL